MAITSKYGNVESKIKPAVEIRKVQSISNNPTINKGLLNAHGLSSVGQNIVHAQANSVLPKIEPKTKTGLPQSMLAKREALSSA